MYGWEELGVGSQESGGESQEATRHFAIDWFENRLREVRLGVKSLELGVSEFRYLGN